jgi:tRNA pseudouridine38-40 synthase
MSEVSDGNIEEVKEEKVENIMPRYFLHMAYDGTNYHGWQRQANSHSIQAEMETALSKLLRQDRVITTGCGRTDAGVHAKNFYFHFNTYKEIEEIPEVLRKLNMMLPWDLAVYDIFRVPDRAHTRFDAYERSYEYHIHQVRDPFIQENSYCNTTILLLSLRWVVDKRQPSAI